jgi:hypothetical protein
MVARTSDKCLRQIGLAFCLVFVVMAWASILSGGKALAAEDGKGFYLLGSTTSLAGIVPPPGMYGVSYKYFYSGSASGGAAISEALGQIGNVTLQADVDVDADVFIDVLTPLWVLPTTVFGGNLAVGALVPIGWQDIDVDINALATLTLANGTVLTQGQRLRLGDDVTAFGDPVALAMLGWHQGNWHWKVAGMLNIPVGQYDKNDIANMGFNRWAFDANAAATWLDPTRGHEASVTAGFTFNGDNNDTNYKTGTEFHVEFALMQHFSKAFSAGLAGYHYQQVTGDSGAGATLGSFKGRVTALGPQINYNFQLGQLPVSTSLRYFHEFDTKNRLEGDAGYLVVTIPLGGPRN